MFDGYFEHKRVLVTGHTGFKGGWIALWLKKLGAQVSGLSLPPPTQPSFYEIIENAAFVSKTNCDIRDLEQLEQVLLQGQPEIIFHFAAQPIVRRSYEYPLETLETNAIGTAKLFGRNPASP